MRKRVLIAAGTGIVLLLLAWLFIAGGGFIAPPVREGAAAATDCPPDPPTSTPWPVQATYTPEYTHTPPATNTNTPTPTNTATDMPTSSPTCPPTATTIIRPPPTPYSTNTPYPVLTSTLIIHFEQSFENLDRAPQAGPYSDVPDCYYPFDFAEQGNWYSYYDPLRNILALEHDTVHSGATALRMEMARPAPIPYDWRRINVGIEWDKWIPDDEVWVSFWIFLPDDFYTESWITLLDFRQGGCGKWHLYLSQSGDDLYMRFAVHWYNKPAGAIDPPGHTRTTHPLPLGRWIHVQAYYRQHLTDGQIIVWHDTDAGPDTEVLNVAGFTSHAVGAGCDMLIHWRYYSPYGPNVLYWDDLVVADGWVPRDYVVMGQ